MAWRTSAAKKSRALNLEAEEMARSIARGYRCVVATTVQNQQEKWDFSENGLTVNIKDCHSAAYVWAEYTDENGGFGWLRSPTLDIIRFVTPTERIDVRRDELEKYLGSRVNWLSIDPDRTYSKLETCYGRNFRLGNSPPIPDRFCKVSVNVLHHLPGTTVTKLP
jgi:hypothetical protein